MSDMDMPFDLLNRALVGEDDEKGTTIVAGYTTPTRPEHEPPHPTTAAPTTRGPEPTPAPTAPTASATKSHPR